MLKRHITLISDFGSRDYYVPSLTARIADINPDASVHHLSHEVGRQNIVEAAFTLRNAYPFFPAGTIHVIIVDPEVGSDRDAVAVEHDGHFFVAPDNGILTLALQTTHPERVVSIKNSPYADAIVSPVFHGRDIFVPVAAWMSRGVPLQITGVHKPELIDLRWGLPSWDRQKIAGQVIHIDHFGNLITNISEKFLDHWAGGAGFKVGMAGWDPLPLSRIYSDVEPGDPVALIGSGGLLEIAVYQADAAALFDVRIGTQIIVSREVS